MKNILIAALILAQSSAKELCDLEQSVPRDVGQFMMRYASCEHWGGEEPYDAARRREIERAVRELRCDRLRTDEETLNRRYFDKPDILTSITLAKEEISWPDCRLLKQR